MFLHVFRNILTIKSTKFKASLANCVCYTFSAIVIKFIAETDLSIAIMVQATTNFVGNWLAMWVYEITTKKGGMIMTPEEYQQLSGRCYKYSDALRKVQDAEQVIDSINRHGFKLSTIDGHDLSRDLPANVFKEIRLFLTKEYQAIIDNNKQLLEQL